MKIAKPALALAAALAVGVPLGGCGDDSPEPAPTAAGSQEATSIEDLGPIHVHGLGVNPSGDALFVATHTGLFRIPDGESEATRVGDNYQDTMGFTIVGPDEFLGSGHPDLRQDLPPYLGLIESDNAGESWEPKSLLGEADFHVLEASGARISGFGSDFETQKEQFLVSRDTGKTWSELEPPESLLSLAINPDDPDELLASGQGELYHSEDAGTSWQGVDGEPGLLSWPEPGSVFLVDEDGSVLTSTEPGAEWQGVGQLDGAPAAFEAASSDELYAALHDGSIGESMDGGASWTIRSTP